MSILDRVNQAVKTISDSKENDIMSANAPAILKGLSGHVKTLPALMGFAGFAEMVGTGDNPIGSKAANMGGGVASANFGDKEAYGHIDGELLAAGLNIKKLMNSAMLAEQLSARKEHRAERPINETSFFKNFVEPVVKGYDLGTFTNWVPTSNTRFYLDEFHIPPGLADLLPQLPMQTRVQEVPTATGELLGLLELDTATFSPQYEAQSKITLTSRDNVCHTDITEDLIEDAVPSMFDRLREKIMLGLQKSKDRAILDGDTTNPHQDADVTYGTTDFRCAWDGLRKKAIVNTAYAGVTNNGDALNKAIFDGMIAAMGEFFTNPNECLWIMSAKQKNKIITGSIPELLTLWSFGQQATLLTGTCPPIYGCPVHVARHQRNDISATAVQTGAGAAANAFTTLFLIKKDRLLVGQRAGVRIWASPALPTSDKMLMTGKERVSFGAVTQSVTETSIVMGYNILS